MNNYRKIVVADNEEGEEKYKSDYRGRVQDKNCLLYTSYPYFPFGLMRKQFFFRQGSRWVWCRGQGWL